ncbi:helix-turn-helix domain-containing protein [Neorhizobium alkalisoli]|uniref:AraC-like DNA-binding protein n=1 Tax=Neorhizobium alkalisoli TaxID=528178 RepID=A0A561QAI7_9HYPH|nr:AraC family transcriptional regulator [Neorhizobium alkalisoli]TWF47379.1 AraC-like DNA-binding protein [Neorhizobium alkalisoli]
MDARARCGKLSSDIIVDEPLRCAIECDTDCVRASDRFEVFRNWHSAVMNVELKCGDVLSFEAKEKIWQIGEIAFAAIDHSPLHLLCWEHKKKPAVDNWVVTVKAATADGPKNPVSNQRLRIANLVVPGTYESEGSLIALFLPYGAVDAPLHPEIADHAAEFLADYLILLSQNLSHLRRSDVFRIGEATIHLVSAVLLPSREKLAQAQAPIDAVITTRAIRAIDARLADADLSPERLCRTIGVSRSRLYRIFEPAGGISNYIRRKRLLETRRALSDSNNVYSISQIAEKMGFTDPSNYSRMFKREFGLSPKEARMLGWQGIVTSETVGSDVTIGTLNSLLVSNSLGLTNFHS